MIPESSCADSMPAYKIEPYRASAGDVIGALNELRNNTAYIRQQMAAQATSPDFVAEIISGVDRGEDTKYSHGPDQLEFPPLWRSSASGRRGKGGEGKGEGAGEGKGKGKGKGEGNCGQELGQRKRKRKKKRIRTEFGPSVIGQRLAQLT